MTQLASPNDCIVAPVDSTERQTTGSGLSGSNDVVVSPRGENVYVVGSNDEAIAEFARDADGALTQLDSPNDCVGDPSNDGSSSCTDGLKVWAGIVDFPGEAR